MRPLIGLVAAFLACGFVAEAHAGVPGGLRLQRRGRTSGRMIMPSKPVNVDSSRQIDALKKALTALGATDRDYDGHREKAIYHVGAAIRHLEMPNAKGKNSAAVEKAADGKPAASTKTATTPQAASDESLRKAKTILFALHHQLEDHMATAGHHKADSEVLIAIKEIVDALNPPKPKPTTATATATPAATTPGKPAK